MTRSARVELNRAALDALDLAVADGLLEHAEAIVEAANPPDAPPYGKGLVESGGAAVWAGKKKVGGGKTRGKAVAKPRAVRLQADVITAVGGFGFPARFQEMGTSRQPARPFLSPVFLGMAPDAGGAIRSAVARHGAGRKP